MSVVLHSIGFNWDRRNAPESSLNIRRNESTEVILPEYRRGKTTEPAESPVAYALALAGTGRVEIELTLRLEAGDPRLFEVRADGGGVLGRVEATGIEAPDGVDSVTVRVPLDARSFAAVGRHDVRWDWFWKASSASKWSPLASTRHRVYLVLDRATGEWNPAFASKGNPWTDLLDFSCRLAEGGRSSADVTRALTQAINAAFHLKYDIEHGSHRYFGMGFDLTEWIERVLRGRPTDAPFLPGCPRERYLADWIVNCMDCGGAVTLMAGILGAPVGCVTQSPFGYLNLVEPIGRGQCNNPFYGCDGDPVVPAGGHRSPFSFHAFATCDELWYDACLKVWVSWPLRLALWLAWLILLLASLGSMRRDSLRQRAMGWLTSIPRDEYESLVIDPYVAGSTPVPGPIVRQKVFFR